MKDCPPNQTGAATAAYREGFDRIFGRKSNDTAGPPTRDEDLAARFPIESWVWFRGWAVPAEGTEAWPVEGIVLGVEGDGILVEVEGQAVIEDPWNLRRVE